jgi:hypothetical protein
VPAAFAGALATFLFSGSAAAQGSEPPLVFVEVGPGTEGSFGVPRLYRQGVPAAGEAFALDVSYSWLLNQSPGFAFIGPNHVELPLPEFGGSLHVGSPFTVVPFSLGLDGTAPGLGFVEIDPVLPEFLGAQPLCQAAILDPGAQGFWVLTNAVRIGFGSEAAAPFAPVQSMAVVGAPWEVVLEDFTGDGLLDVALGKTPLIPFYPGGIDFYTGNGDGTLTPGGMASLNHQVLSLRGGDFNDDGLPDLVIVEAQSTSIEVRFGDGAGDFNAQHNVDVGLAPWLTRPGDADGDGREDVLIVTLPDPLTHQSIGYVLRNNGTNVMELPVPVGLAPGRVDDVDLGDVTGDGLADLVVTGEAGLLLHRGLGGGQFVFVSILAEEPSDLERRDSTLADFDGDGLLDLATVYAGPADRFGELQVRLGTGNGGFASPSIRPTNFGPTRVLATEATDDGHLDLVVLHRGGLGDNGTLGTFPGDGQGGFGALLWSSSQVLTPAGFALGDLDGDGDEDAVIANTGPVGIATFAR